ncbi:MAG TPA: AAA family ATPase, partial [Cyclobacteriaceae bacterium]|nr:AAA family ATPase [Cyclobacteriaceae bacterium]
MSNLKEVEQSVQQIISSLNKLKQEIKKVIVGQDEIIDQLLITFLAGGHALLEGVPGLAKTLMIRSLSEAIDLRFRRIQFTPDLMPSDIIGTEILEEDHTTGKRIFKFNKGPLFANIILADEINRTSPKTQSALLEAMQEF